MAERRCCGALPQCRENQGGPITVDCRMCERSPTFWRTTAEGSRWRPGRSLADDDAEALAVQEAQAKAFEVPEVERDHNTGETLRVRR